ncbi:lysophospholipid acyltransferase family protein [Aerosakkonemataceae cyanobacterium BLCC-F50]|uniref:Lysophospholipid acyltransferase family protein n=1 Tax=Floridaenema flaviceps BLCC-F50 TaxID=3153642 RepID=A0ABV4Y0I1_9CYAN
MMTQVDSSSRSLATITSTNLSSSVSPGIASLAYPIGRYIVLPVYFGQISVKGRENLPQEGPLIFAPTHRSRWDPFMLGYAAGRDITGRDLHFMVSANEMLGIQGWFIRRMGGFPVDTDHPGISSIRHGIELLQQEKVLVMFPEGNIFRENCIQPLKPGFARIALQAEASKCNLGIKVVPIAIKYSQEVPHRGCNVAINIGSPLKVVDYRSNNVKRSAQSLTEDLQASLTSLYQCPLSQSLS